MFHGTLTLVGYLLPNPVYIYTYECVGGHPTLIIQFNIYHLLAYSKMVSNIPVEL